MLEILYDGFAYLSSQSWASLIALFWFVILFEMPRYTINFVTAGLMSFFQKPPAPMVKRPKISLFVAGHNEADAIERCLLAVQEQSWIPDEIIVISDGSTDTMTAKLRELRSRGLLTHIHSTGLRAGKSAASNLGIQQSTGDIIINIDCDCTLDRFAFQRACELFSDPDLGAVGGNIVVRNAEHSYITGYQSIEYLVILSLGKRGGNLTGQVVCASGAFGVFRRKALDDVGGLDAGGGEDLDVTIRMRKAGWRVRFAPDAICYTDAPNNLHAFIRQRFRWERDAIRLRYRKHRDQVSPFSTVLKPSELVHQLEFITFDILAAIAMPFYLIWLFLTYGDAAPAILIAAQIGIFCLDAISLGMVALTTPKVFNIWHIVYMPGYSVLNSYFMRFVRLSAYFQEWIFDASYTDSYVPNKVHMQRY